MTLKEAPIQTIIGVSIQMEELLLIMLITATWKVIAEKKNLIFSSIVSGPKCKRSNTCSNN